MKMEEQEGGEESKIPISSSSVEPVGEAKLRRVAALVDDLISFSKSIKSFVGKWQSIRNKLEQLSSGLTSAAAGAGSGCRTIGNSVLHELLHTISSTVDQTHELASGCCADESYAGGKLLMRSNLDLSAAKFDLHIKSLAGIYASGILSHSNAIVVSKPGPGASRDDMRFYVKDLLSRLKIGDGEMKARALTALGDVLREDERYTRIAAVETSEILTLLAGFLEYRDLVIQEEAAEAVSVIAGVDSCRPALVFAVVVPPLVRVLETGSELGKERAAWALKKLTENSNNAWSVSAHGGVTVLLKICGSGGKGELVGSACGVLRNLLGVAEIRRFMVEGGAVPIFLKLMRSKEEVSQIHAMEFLQAMASEDTEAKATVLREGGVDSLLRILDQNSSSSSKAREIALRAIESFCFYSSNSMNVLMGSGFLDRVLFLLRNGEISIQESALKSAARLCGLSEEARKVMGEIGFMPEMVKLLEARSFEVREMAARAISSMVSVQKNKKRFVQEEQNVSKILQVLNQDEEKPLTKKLLLSALMSLSDSNSGRRKIAGSVYVKNLEKLAAETDHVDDAKRIVKKIYGNRFRSLLQGIWS